MKLCFQWILKDINKLKGGLKQHKQIMFDDRSVKTKSLAFL